MSYPSLMFLSEPTGVRMRADAFEDLKLTLLVSQPVIESMLDMCTREDILARQELFRSLENDETREQAAQLSALMDELYRFYDAYIDSNNDDERRVIFVGLMKAAVQFTEAAAQFKADGVFYERFHTFFQEEIARPEYKTLAADIDAVFPQIGTLQHASFIINGDDLRITSAMGQPYEQRLIECARNLGLENISAPRSYSRPMAGNIIDAIAALYPDAFEYLDEFYDKYINFFNEDIMRYYRELSFYIELSQIFARIRKNGIPVCYPTIAEEKCIHVSEAYDVTLLAKNETNIIPNDIHFTTDEPFFYLTGANGGGKTTYLRAVGAVTVFFLTGCPIAARKAEFYPLKKVLIHFPRDERFDSGGRFQNENALVNEILEEEDGSSLILLNETYSATSEELAVPLTVALAERLYKSGSFGIYITHQHGVGETNIPFLNVVVDTTDSNRRTYKIARQQGSQSSMALDILKKYNLDRDSLLTRFGITEKGEEA